MTPSFEKQKLPIIFLLGVNPSSAAEMISLANQIQSDGRYSPLLIITDPAVYEQAKTQLMEQVICLFFKDFASVTIPSGTWQKWTNKIANLFHYDEINQYKLKLQKEYHAAQALFNQYRPVALLSSGDRLYKVEPAFIRVFREAKKPIIIIPYALPQPSEVAYYRVGKSEFDIATAPYRLLKMWIKLRYPNQVFINEGKKLLFYTPPRLLALAQMQMLSPNPWVNGAGYSTLVGTTNAQGKKNYENWGVPASKVKVFGQPSLDDLYQTLEQKGQIRQMLIEKYELKAEKKIMLFAVPQNAEDGLLTEEEQEEEIHLWLESLSKIDANLILSLHPKSEKSKYEILIRGYHVRIIDEPMKKILSGVDIHISAFSSTAQWACLLGIPAVGMLLASDKELIAEFDGDRWTYMQGFIPVKNLEELVQTLGQMVSDNAYYHKLQVSQANSENVAPFDGQTINRILEAVEEQLSLSL